MALQKVKGNLERMFDKNLNDLVRGIRLVYKPMFRIPYNNRSNSSLHTVFAFSAVQEVTGSIPD
jgi:hypothetical protein